MEHPTAADLEAGLDDVRRSPPDDGPVELIVSRPAPGRRKVLAVGELDVSGGLVGDGWRVRSSRRTPDGSPHPDMQLTLMNSRAARLVAGDPSRWGLAGDQLYVDFDVSVANIPAGTRLSLGSAVVEITAQPHLGCGKFADRFGRDALRWVRSTAGTELRLRGVYARVVEGGVVRPGDRARTIPT